jgi:hypothetical protein
MLGTAKAARSVPRAGVEAVDRVDQADRARLHQVVLLGPTDAVAPREASHERQVQLDQLAAGVGVACLDVRSEQPFDRGAPLDGAWLCWMIDVVSLPGRLIPHDVNAISAR